jgi:hypothetical protein
MAKAAQMMNAAIRVEFIVFSLGALARGDQCTVDSVRTWGRRRR